nr:uncharacterized protein LOC121124471 [Lepeophtheirus salmonis]
MKLIQFIALIQTFLLIVDYCSAEIFVSRFEGKWCEYKKSRYHVVEVMRDLNFSRELIHAYLYGRPASLHIQYIPSHSQHVLDGQDPTGRHHQLYFHRTQNQSDGIYFFGTHYWFISSYDNHGLNMAFYKRYHDAHPYIKLRITKGHTGYLRLLITSQKSGIFGLSDFSQC